jgi:hypothetical protein
VLGESRPGTDGIRRVDTVVMRSPTTGAYGAPGSGIYIFKGDSRRLTNPGQGQPVLPSR